MKGLKPRKILKNRTITIYVYSATVFYIIKTWGSRTSLVLMRMIGPLIVLSKKNKWELVPIRITSSLNILADGPFRERAHQK